MGTDRFGMRIAVDWDIRPQTIQKTTAYSLACMVTHTHTRIHAVSEINSSTLNCRRVFVLKRGVRQIPKNEIEKSKMIKQTVLDPDEVVCEPSHLDLHCFLGPSLQVCSVERSRRKI